MRYSLFLVFCLGFGMLPGQVMINRYDPGLHNKFLGAYTLNDSTYRVISKSDRGSVRGFSSFIVTDYSKGIPTFRDYGPEAFDYPPMYGTYELSIIALPNGDAIMVGNFFDCDIGGMNAIYISSDHHIDWYLSSDQLQSSSTANGVGLVSPEVIVLYADAGEDIYLTFNGEQVWYETPPADYTHIGYSGQFTFGYRDALWYKLDASFQPVDSMNIDTITFLGSLGSSFLVQTADTMTLVDSSLQTIASREVLEGIHTVENIGSHIGLASNDTFYILDSALNITQVYHPLPGESMKLVMSHGDSAYILSRYNGNAHSDFISRKYVLGEILTTHSPDLNLHFIDLPDTVQVAHPNEYWYSQWQFGMSFFEVENMSDDTVDNFRLECSWRPWATNCTHYERTWSFDGVHLAPGETRIFELLPFVADSLVIGFHAPFCFWIESANGFPDPNPADNYSCDSPQIVAGSKDISVIDSIRFYPNPAGDEYWLTGKLDDLGEVQVNFYSIHGLHEKSVMHSSTQDPIQIHDLPEGIHIVQVTGRRGLRGMQKLIIQR